MPACCSSSQSEESPSDDFFTSQLPFSPAPILIPVHKAPGTRQFIMYIPMSIDVPIQSPGEPLGPHPPGSLCTSLRSSNQHRSHQAFCPFTSHLRSLWAISSTIFLYGTLVSKTLLKVVSELRPRTFMDNAEQEDMAFALLYCYCFEPGLTWNSECNPRCSGNPNSPPASASRVMGLQARATVPSCSAHLCGSHSSGWLGMGVHRPVCFQ